MRPPRRKIAFVLAASDHGAMILNRFDYRMVNPTAGYGVGYDILEGSSFDPTEVDLLLYLLNTRRQYFGDGVVALDCGANIGVHTIEWAKRMAGWGSVVAIEAQERIYYALAGNIAINNCFNARAIHAAVSDVAGKMKIPVPNYQIAASFGSLELKKHAANEFIGQAIDYSDEKMAEVRTVKIDTFALNRLDLIKIDIEGMELEAVEGAAQSIEAHWPIMLIESIKTDKVQLRSRLTAWGYELFDVGLSLLAIHSTDRCREHVKRKEAVAADA